MVFRGCRLLKRLRTYFMAPEPAAKRKAVESVIGTHSGVFHCDDALACFLLQQLPEYKHSRIVRSRDADILKGCDVVVDVGGVYDHSSKRYDHHQRGFSESVQTLLENKKWVTKLSSAGLVYCHYGHQIIADILGKDKHEVLVDKLFDKIYENFIEEVDAIDNGINISEGETRYKITTNLSSRVRNLNPGWNCVDVNFDELFPKAMELTGGEFLERVHYFAEQWWPARAIVEKSLQERLTVDKSGHILELPQGGVPWTEHLYNLEKEMSLGEVIKFVIFTDLNGDWRVRGVNLSQTNFNLRVGLLEEWRGVRECSSVPGFVFVHANGFIGGNKTRDGAIYMARKSLEAKGLISL